MHEKVKIALESAEQTYKQYFHKDYGEIRSPMDFANALNTDLRRITKTLFLKTEGGKKEFGLVVCPIPSKLNIPVVSAAFGCLRAGLGNSEELSQVLGYPSHGVSPLGNHLLPTLLDEELFNFPKILVGSGVLGEEIELSPEDLIVLTKGERGVFCLNTAS